MSEVTRHEPDISDDTRALVRRCLADAEVVDGVLIVAVDTANAAICYGALAGARIAEAHLHGHRHCRVCGCTDLRTCAPDDPCHWVGDDLCSACEPFVKARQ